MALSPSWAMSGQAVDAAADAHLSKGIHFRVLLNPLLGLPVAPLAVGKIGLGRGAKGWTRSDVLWVDSHGSVQALPFTVTPDNPVTGYLPLGATACWAMITGEAGRVGRPLPGGVVREPAGSAPPGRIELPGVAPAGVASRIREVPGVVVPSAVVPGSLIPGPLIPGPRIPGISFSAPFALTGVVATPLGDAPVAVRSQQPYHVYASHIERLVVTGSGTVRSVAWLPASAVTVTEPFRIEPLPAKSGARYSGPSDGYDQGIARVERGAPQRYGMHESPLAPNPPGCVPASTSDEVLRVKTLAGDLAGTLDQLLNDTSAEQWDLLAVERVLDANGVDRGSSDRLILYDLLQASVDPGVARWLGLLDVDEDAATESQIVFAYVVEGLFRPDWDAIAKAGLSPTLEPDGTYTDGRDGLKRLALTQPQIEKFIDVDLGEGPFLLQRMVLAATGGVPLDSPSAPQLDPPLDLGWLPLPAPEALREFTIGLERLVPGAGLASALAQPSGQQPVERNPKDRIGRRRLLVPTAEEFTLSPTSGVLADRTIGEPDGQWQLAQLDWFGRWSGWSRRGFGAGVRPRPPRPTLTLTSIPPVVGNPMPTGPLAGTVRVEVSVPEVAGLAAGGRLLDHLELSTTGGASPGTTSYPIADPTNPPEVMVVMVDGPALAPTASGTVTVTATWFDSALVASDPSEPKTATLHDPRPPTPVVLPPTLTYTARPDSTGRAKATLTFSPVSGQAAFRVFVADETTLRSKLAEVAAGQLAAGDAGQAPSPSQAQGLLDALDAAVDPPARGAVWDANRHLLPRRWWLQLTGEPLPAPSSGPVVFSHDVSGSLAVLVLYRVVALSAASVETDFATSPLLPRAVPNLLVPTQPVLEVTPVMDGSGNLQAQLTVTVPSGPTPATRYRLRRATTTTETMLMPIVGQGALPPRTSPSAAQVAVVMDTGNTLTGPRTALPAWVQYHWRVEVQGPPAPGGGPDGEWSSASPAASAVILPPDPPVMITDLTATRDAAGVHVRFRQPESLAGGGTNGYVVDVYRQLPGSGLRLLSSVAGQAPAPTGRGSNASGFFDVLDADPTLPAGTGYRVVVTDPIGRMSAPSPLVEAP